MKKIALVGNPNTGKTSLFNRLTGLNQHVGNFPGVTVDKKVGKLTVENTQLELVDLPGTYSIYPHSIDEKVVYDILSNPNHPDYPSAVFVVLDASNLERNLLLFTQLYDLNVPLAVVLNRSDLAYRSGKIFDMKVWENRFPDVPIIETNARTGLGLERLKKTFTEEISANQHTPILSNHSLKAANDSEAQSEETKLRFDFIAAFLAKFEHKKASTDKFSEKLDKILVHPFWGYAIFAFILLLVFQLIFTFASYPMDWIDSTFGNLSEWTSEVLPPGVFTDLLSKGIIPGLGGVVIFIPQIALLFFCIGILEETGYMARVVFMMDRLMRPFGLNGKSVVPLMSSVACAIPGVMAARTISNWRERMITIMVAPLMSCSARIPVYTLLITLVIPSYNVFGFLNLQGLVLFALYSLGLISALFVAWVMKRFLRSKDQSFLMLEMPEYQNPRWGNVGINVLEKVRIFVWDAGKIILAVSIILWSMASYGPGNRMENAVDLVKKQAVAQNLSAEHEAELISSAQLENSYMGILGKGIEPVIRPLGYDWKIGISLIASFAAREVFVGSMATIYSVHDDGEENRSLIERMRSEKKKDGTPVYTLASGLSLMIFYVYAMQCMSTLAVVKRETKSWKWPLIQLMYMGVLAYVSSYLIFKIFS